LQRVLKPDVFALYERIVQSPDADVAFIDQVFRTRNRRAPRTLREDFCGSAALSAAWVNGSPERRAVAVDNDPRVLAYARRAGRESSRLTLRCADVLDDAARARFDVIAAYNFSVFVLKSRSALTRYFARVHRALAPRGMFFMDVFGGLTAEQVSLETRDAEGVTYIWEQASFELLTRTLRAYIHFRLADGRTIRRAFKYDWRLWQLVELREALAETGFRSADVYWEDRDEDGEGTGRFRRRTRVESEPSWNAYVVAQR
jgi:SAM-dependent methyltransferase